MIKKWGWVVLLFLAGVVFARVVLMPPDDAKPPVPQIVTDTVFVHDTLTLTEIEVRWRVQTDTINLVQTVTVYDTTRIACQQLKPRRRIIAAVFGETYGDSTLVLSERMSFVNDSLSFQKLTENIYTNGIVRRISIDSVGSHIEWKDFPIQRNSISFFKKVEYILYGVAGYIILDKAAQIGKGSSSDRGSSNEHE